MKNTSFMLFVSGRCGSNLLKSHPNELISALNKNGYFAIANDYFHYLKKHA